MLSSYLRIAWRSLQKRFGHTFINVLGLSVGLAACLLIGLWVNHELSYDDFHPEAERIQRIVLDAKVQDREITGPLVPAPLAATLRDGVPEVATATRFRHFDDQVFRVDNQAFTGQTVLNADSAFFDVFGGFDLLHGNRETALQSNDAVVLTASTAERLFGTTMAIGKTLEWRDNAQRVTGVLDDVPKNSHVHFDAVATEELSPQRQTRWVTNNWYTYVKLVPGTSPTVLKRKVNSYVEKYVAPQVKTLLGMPLNQMLEQGARYQFMVQPLTAIHLRSQYQYELEANGSIAYVYTFSAIALFILLIACVNFMNLATARASERATEVGMRKALGAYRWQLVGQFLGEALLTTAFAALLAVGLAALALPVFNGLAGTTFDPAQLVQPPVLLGGLAFVIVVGLLAGSYPAIVLSQFQPASVLKAADRHGTSGGAKWLRQGLVIFQFIVSIVLIIGTLVVQDQFSYIQEKRLGIDKEHVMTVDRTWALDTRQAAFIDRISQLSGVAAAGSATSIFRGGMSNTVFIPDDAPSSQSRSMNFLQVGFNFVEAMGIEVVSGRTFSPDRSADSSAVLINQAAADALDWDDPTRHHLREPIGDEGARTFDVIGVVENFHYESMRQQVQPLVLRPDDVNSTLYVRMEPGVTTSAIEAVRRAWAEVAPDQPFQYTFLDQTYAELHRDTQRAGRLFSIFAGLAIVIACLGLFGLATYTAQRRAREIGIRKALGATSTQIVGLLSREFLQLVAIAFVVALPIAYYAMQQWLQDFAYRTEVGVGIFMLAGVLAGGIALLTVSYQAFRASATDPATVLRSE